MLSEVDLMVSATRPPHFFACRTLALFGAELLEQNLLTLPAAVTALCPQPWAMRPAWTCPAKLRGPCELAVQLFPTPLGRRVWLAGWQPRVDLA
ncbi:hypothetical protein MTO96_010081 [Rhipicephalus appendiculatus]